MTWSRGDDYLTFPKFVVLTVAVVAIFVTFCVTGYLVSVYGTTCP